MKKAIILMLMLLVLISISGCTAQERAKSFGGEYTLQLDDDQKLVNVTWKEDTLWYLTKDMTETDVAESYTFKADSSYGIFEGTVYIQEGKSK